MSVDCRLTAKRRENLARIFSNLLTVVVAGIVVPSVLRSQTISVSILLIGIAAVLFLATLIWLLES
jgi:hypothetical protein